jgi:hypothetical protein
VNEFSTSKKEISLTKPSPKILFVSGGSAPYARKPETKESLSIDAAPRTAGTIGRRKERKQTQAVGREALQALP